MEIILSLLIGGIVAGGGVFFFLKQKENVKLLEEEKKLLEVKQNLFSIESEIREKKMQVKEIENKAKNDARDILTTAKTEISELRLSLEKDRTRVEEQEKGIERREKELDTKFSSLETLKEKLAKKEEELSTEQEKAKLVIEEQKSKLAEIAHFSEDEAKKMLMDQVENETRGILAKHIDRTETELKEESKKRAQKIIALAIQKYASEVASENTTTAIELPSDEMKGRIIGREGRNINSIEHVTGVDVIVDDTPNTIMISGFDLVRRYNAKVLIERLIEDGRIHPARIEEMAEKIRKETDELLKEFGEKVLLEMGITGIHPDLARILGRLRFRTSYGQNQLKHAQEVSYIATAIAGELGIDTEKAKIAGLFHDIGKAVDHEIEGSHAMIGYEILKKYGVDEEIAYAVGAHHEDMPIKSALDFVICAADAISGARPGARRESAEAYVKRLKDLEGIALSFEGVEKAFAIQAGRELRIMANPAKLDDYGTKKLALSVAGRIEKEMTYPGQIKVHVIREIRETEFAK